MILILQTFSIFPKDEKSHSLVLFFFFYDALDDESRIDPCQLEIAELKRLRKQKWQDIPIIVMTFDYIYINASVGVLRFDS